MRARLPSDLLGRSAQESSRLLALTYLDQIDHARARLGDPLDRDALHDFRVGLRRLRSVIRAYRTELEGSVSRKMQRQLRDLARTTNDDRDLEVQLAWLEQQAGRQGPEDIRGFFWLAGRLEGRQQRTRARATGNLVRRYAKAADKLRSGLGILQIELATSQGERPATFREVTGGLVRQQVTRVREDLARIRDSSDAEQVHRTRISLKRLRYLLEPIARGNRRAGALVRRFKEAQDLLGEYHDMHVLSAAIASLRTGLSASSLPGVEPGLATVGRLSEETAAAAFERFQSLWDGELGLRILARADELGTLLQQPPPPTGNGTRRQAQEVAVTEPARLNGERPIVTETG
jgi:CHAD domain-containing protein